MIHGPANCAGPFCLKGECFMAYKLKTDLAHRSNYGNKRPLSAIEWIVIHFTANDGDTDEANGNYFDDPNRNASAHYFVDDDSVTQSVPDDYVAWSVGGNKYSNCGTTGGGKYYSKATNANTLNIEICDDVKNGSVYPSEKTIENTIELTKKKMKQYNIPASRVIRHFDVTGKACPAYWCGSAANDKKWKTEFHNKLTATSTTTKTSTKTTTTASNASSSTKTSYLVKVDKVAKGDVLNIREKPNASAKITGKLAYNDPNTYTIIEENNGWGKLKSELGWINLYYTKKVTKAAATKQVSIYYPKYTGNSYGIDTVFKAIGVPETFRGDWKNRKPIAEANGIKNYTGGITSNLKMITLAKQGKLKKA